MASNRRPAAGSTNSDHGENKRTWFHCTTDAPACAPRSSTSGSRPRSSTSAAAASPIGPAPTTTTGSSLIPTPFIDPAR